VAQTDPTCPVAFGRLLHAGTPGQLTITTIPAKRDGGTGVPYSRAFTSKRAWLAELEHARHAEGHHFSFSSYTGACQDGSATGVTVGNVLSLTAFYLDLDWHLHPVASTKFSGIADILAEVDRRCDAIGFARPALVTSSGRGLLVAWPFKPVPAYWRACGGSGRIMRDGALVRWNVGQRYLHELFADLGSDAAASPACHWFKLPGTVNPKSGNTVACLRRHRRMDRGSFSNLYGMLEPTILAAHKRGELRAVPLPKSMRKAPTGIGRVIDLAVQRASRRGQTIARRGADGLGATAADTAGLIWAPRLRALVKLSEHRAAANDGRLPRGQRDCILFVTGLAMAWCSRSGWEEEFLELASRLTPWPQGEARTRLSAVIKRAQQEQGDGTGLYKMNSETLRAFIGLTVEEEELDFASPIASPAARRQHALRRLRVRRREGGRADREATTGADRPAYFQQMKAAAADKAASAHEMHRQGIVPTDIAATLGCDVRSVRRYLSKPMPPSTEIIPAVQRSLVQDNAQEAEASLRYRAHHLTIADGLEPWEVASRLDVSLPRVRAWLRKPLEPLLAA
jgi:hypothetical protein